MDLLDGTINGNITRASPAIAGSVTIGGEPDYYEGAYTMTPVFENQVLTTRGKTMKEDFTIKEIPVAEVSNPAGGLTLTIG